MARDHDPRDTALMERPSRGGPAPRPSPPRMRGFWPLLALIVGGTLALVFWAIFATGTTAPEPGQAPASEYTGDWKDLVGSTTSPAADPAGETYTGDWKDLVGSN
jgi:hypothetical protein